MCSEGAHLAPGNRWESQEWGDNGQVQLDLVRGIEDVMEEVQTRAKLNWSFYYMWPDTTMKLWYYYDKLWYYYVAWYYFCEKNYRDSCYFAFRWETRRPKIWWLSTATVYLGHCSVGWQFGLYLPWVCVLRQFQLGLLLLGQLLVSWVAGLVGVGWMLAGASKPCVCPPSAA